MGSHAHRFGSRSALGRRIATVVALATLAVVMVALSASPAAATPTPHEFEVCLLDKINASRAADGAAPLEMAWDRIDQVRDWSEWMRHNDFRHMNNAERAPILPDGTWTWGENIAWTSNRWLEDCTQIHEMFMNSPGHRANILSANKQYAALGAHFDTSGWWVTELFFSARGYDPGCYGTFCDDDGSYFEDYIEQLAALGLTNGCSADAPLFCPKDLVTRAELAAFLVRLLGLTDRGSIDFVDDDGSPFEADIEKLATAGITRGCKPAPDPRFCPNDHVTRDEMSALIARALGLVDRGSVDFADDDGSPFEADIERLAAAGITVGCATSPEPLFCPRDPVTRETMAAFLIRMESYIVR